MNYPTVYRAIQVDGLVYREAEQKTRQHFSCCTDSVFLADVRASLTRLSDYTLSPCRARLPRLRTQCLAEQKQLAYTFDHIAETMNHFTEALWALALHALHPGTGGPVRFLA